jgi:hypothetical protein
VSLQKTGHALQATAKRIAEIAIELNGVAHDLQGDPEALRLRALGVQVEAKRLALAALAAGAAGEQIACAARGKAGKDADERPAT